MTTLLSRGSQTNGMIQLKQATLILSFMSSRRYAKWFNDAC